MREIPITERDDSGVIANAKFAFLLNAGKNAQALRKWLGGIDPARLEISFGICSNVSPICKVRAVCDSMPDSDKPKIALRPRIRLLHRGEIVMGPGKAELLTRIAETGSLSEAARRMKMSYMKAWLLVQVMNRSYRKPLVQAERGGTRGGRARLTSYGRRVLGCYREMEQRSLTAMQEPWKKVRRMLKNSPASR